MSKEKIEMSVELNGQEVVAYPYVNSDHVLLDNNMTIDKMLESDVVEPVITHEEVSFKVGQGDSDLSDSIVDSSAGGFTIKGQTYQNILPEPSLRNSMTNGKTVQKLNEGYDSVSTVDGVCKSAILKGQTLVNVSKSAVGNGVVIGSYWSIGNAKIKLKSNTKYFCWVKNLANDTYYYYFNDNAFNTSSSFSIGYNQIVTRTMTTKENPGTLWLSSDKINTSTIPQQLQIMLIEYQQGMENWGIPYFEGMQSVKMPVLTTVGKNLFDVSSYVKGTLEKQFYSQNGDKLQINALDSRYSTIYATYKVKKGETLTLSTNPKVPVRIFDVKRDTMYNSSTDGILTYTAETDGEIGFKFIANEYPTLINVQLEKGSVATPYEPYKSNILTVNEDVTLRGIGNVKDELNLSTGELTQRIGEVVLDGSESWGLPNWDSENHLSFIYYFGSRIIGDIRKGASDKLPFRSWTDLNTKDIPGFTYGESTNNSYVVFKINKTIVSDLITFKSWLAQNPIKIQYLNYQESVKTVDLSSSGNWEKVVLDGSEEWIRSTTNNNYFMETRASIIPNRVPDVENYFFHDTDLQTLKVYTSNTNIGICIPSNGGVRVRTQEVLNGQSLEEFKQWVSQNPITIWYQTSTHKDSTQVKQPIFFKDGLIQLSSGADNSLIPTLDYQVKTSNSYVMDLMKTNTRYTMKSSSASGNFTIDGTQYNFNTNGTFTTPSTMNNKLMIANGTVTDLMFIEGDVTDKTIPYFKGIKSAFEDEDKIEVLSTGKNLFKQKLTDYDYLGNYAENETIIKDDCIEWNATTSYKGAVYYYINVKPNTKYTLSLQRNIQQTNCVTIYDGFVTSNVNNITSMGANKNSVTFNTKSDKITIRFSNGTILDTLFKIYDVQLEESSIPTQYELHKSNSTKIPLLSPLRSLPNGVRDEVIVDRANNKATLVQRVSEELMKLATPVITEVDLEGYPYIYKDGHIFLNTDIAPTTTIKYSINQAQVIQSQNSDIIRHSKEITNLHRLISEYVQVQYESTLLNLKVKMRA